MVPIRGKAMWIGERDHSNGGVSKMVEVVAHGNHMLTLGILSPTCKVKGVSSIRTRLSLSLEGLSGVSVGYQSEAGILRRRRVVTRSRTRHPCAVFTTMS